MADLITSTRAKLAINQSSFTDDEDDTIEAQITAVSRAIERYCRREFGSASQDELYSGTGSPFLPLRHYPIISVSRVATSPTTVLRITNSSSSNQRATARVSSTGLVLTRVASGSSSSDSTVLFGTYTTLSTVAAAVNLLGNGWSAEVTSDYGLWPSADLRVQGAYDARNAPACLKMHVVEVSDFEVDTRRGWLYRRDSEVISHWLGDHYEVSGWTPGTDNYRVVYTAGYATVPEDVQEACAEWVAALFWMTKDNPASYPDLPPAHVETLIDQYRRITL